MKLLLVVLLLFLLLYIIQIGTVILMLADGAIKTKTELCRWLSPLFIFNKLVEQYKKLK